MSKKKSAVLIELLTDVRDQIDAKLVELVDDLDEEDAEEEDEDEDEDEDD